MSEQQVQVAQAAVSAKSDPPKWGEMPSPERIRVLEDRLTFWEHLPQAERGDPAKDEGGNAFDTRGPHKWGGQLTGADVFYLAARALANSAAPEAIEAAEQRLHIAGFTVSFLFDLSALQLAGSNLSDAQLTNAILYGAQLTGAFLSGAHLEHASLYKTHLERAVLNEAHLEHANLTDAQLEGAELPLAWLNSAALVGTNLNGAFLHSARFDGANLSRAQLKQADLTGASFDKTSRLNDAVLTGASFDQITFDNTNLAVVDWNLVGVLGEEHTARERNFSGGTPKSREKRLTEYKAAVRANRVLAVKLEEQGLNEDAEHFVFRAKVLQRRVLRLQRKPFAYLGSLLLAAVAGYGYRIWRIAVVYAAIVTFFALAYFFIGSKAFEDTFDYLTGIRLMDEQHLALHEAFLLSITNIHGRVFTGTFKIESLQAWFAAAEAVLGILIEGTFVAMLIKRFFGR